MKPKPKYRTVSQWKCNACGATWTRASKASPRICPRCRKEGALRWDGDVKKIIATKKEDEG